MRTDGWRLILAGAVVLALLSLGGGQRAEAGPGDVNDDGFVGGDDLSKILTNWGQEGLSRQEGDLSGDGFVGGDDYTEVLTYWGTPEPATLGLVILGGLAVLIRRRK